jgi:hypothetical protein
MIEIASQIRVNPAYLRETSRKHCVEFIDENGGGPGVRLRKRNTRNPNIAGSRLATRGVLGGTDTLCFAHPISQEHPL